MSNTIIGYEAGYNFTGDYTVVIGTEYIDYEKYKLPQLPESENFNNTKRCEYCGTLHQYDALFCRACQASF